MQSYRSGTGPQAPIDSGPSAPTGAASTKSDGRREDPDMKPGRPIEASEAPDRAKPVRPLLVIAAVVAGAVFLALIFRRLS